MSACEGLPDQATQTYRRGSESGDKMQNPGENLYWVVYWVGEGSAFAHPVFTYTSPLSFRFSLF